ncbi:hypothetical protein [Nonomuraea gerenzanensis]|uniref:Uncharacterized protein n=1 Tax=Nonomuraea gerenzanensis TaxID=93944 RepID=A0A1M4EET6_9ACTN|nr:hypothetical protein [Nonomuraea gerenzanensis]UBU08916.1 hypothetical protein LCN96_31585 [Nonomuraea gerenzanensis]SBO97294.1 hypothetical protein BN4615_P6810 [Nonomuraea gerenzanensis]
MQRPLAHRLAVALLALLWPGLAGGVVLVWQGRAAPYEIFAGVFWSAVWYFWLARVWLGGPMAIGLMRKALYGICPILILAAGLAVGMSDGEIHPSQLTGLGAALCGLAAALLLGRGEVRRWSESAAAPKAVRQPPDGTAFDLRAVALRQNRGMFGCLMMVVAAVVLVVVGLIGAALPADRGTDAPDYIAFMVGVVLVVVIGIAGYIRINLQAKALGVLVITARGVNDHPWSRLRSVSLSYAGEASVVAGVRRHPGVRLDLSLYDEPDEHHLALPNEANVHGSIAAALAAHAPEGVFLGWTRRADRARSAR